jgi:hypothetical protein
LRGARTNVSGSVIPQPLSTVGIPYGIAVSITCGIADGRRLRGQASGFGSPSIWMELFGLLDPLHEFDLVHGG